MNGEINEVPPLVDVATAAAEAQARGVTLMVKSLLPPFYAVEYPEFARQVLELRAMRGEQDPSASAMPEAAEGPRS